MSNAPSKTNATTNPFHEYASALAARRLDGKLLKFIKGDWVFGAEGVVMPEIAELVAVMNSLTIGWQKWKDQRPVESAMGLLVEGFKPPRRSELGDELSATWETDADGNPKDPWRFANDLVLVAPDMGEIYTYSTSSRGGLDAIGALCRSHAKTPAGKYPLVRLAGGAYQHRDRTRGRVKFPIFDVVKLVDAAPFDEALARSRGDEPIRLCRPADTPRLAAADNFDGLDRGHALADVIPF
jgi:hypothetical protein